MSPVSARQILDLIPGARVANAAALGADLDSPRVRGMAELRGSGPEHLCFFFSKEYQAEVPAARPGILVTGEAFVGPLEKSGLAIWSASIIISCEDPYLAMARLSGVFARQGVAEPSGPPRVHPTAVIEPGARLGEGVRVGAQCAIEEGAEIGTGTVLHAGCVVGRGVRVGPYGEIFPNVTLYPGTVIGSHVRIHSGTVIGSDGFGYAPIRQDGRRDGPVVGHEKIHHLGGVRIGNHVEIGANSCVDRGTLGDTVIEDHVKADNLVQIAHNAIAREGAILCGCSGLAGGSVLGRFAYLGGQACVVNKAQVGDGAMVGAASLITKDVGPGEQVAGSPQRALKDHLRANAYLNRVIAKKGDSQ